MQHLGKLLICSWMLKENLESLIVKKFPLNEIYLGGPASVSLKRLRAFIEANPLLKVVGIVENMKGLASEADTLSVINGLVELFMKHVELRKVSIVLHEWKMLHPVDIKNSFVWL